jgi:endonuclease YncB( thermonuclease family)
MTSNTLTKGQYQKLLFNIEKLIESSKIEVNNIIKTKLAFTYWQIGKMIVEKSLTKNAGYESLIISDLARDLSLEKSTLYRCVSFFKTYERFPNKKNLSWSSYCRLLTVGDKNLRLELEDKASKENWSVITLTNAVKKLKESIGNNTQFNNLSISRPTAPTYLYKAYVKNVVDGDTLLLTIDLGFGVLKEQRVRLAQINCAEMNTSKGVEAFEFVRGKLANAEFIMVQTKKIDIYGRYLGHIFYQEDSALLDKAGDKLSKEDVFSKGIYLNEELVQRGFATLV